MPEFSLVIPTLRRPQTLRHALATAVAQDFDDLEVVVQNNGADPDVERVVRGFADTRIRLFATPSVLPMFESWELALGNARGDYITFIGDDDGVFPDACAIAHRAIAATAAELVSWLPFLYYWPQYPDAGRRNRLIATIGGAFRMMRIDSRATLRRVYRRQLDYSRLPMIYNSFVARDVVARVRKRAGCYFMGRSPDVASGIVNAAASPSFIRLTRPLSVTGISRHSTGHNTFYHRVAPADDPDFLRDFGRFTLDPRLAGATNLQAMIAQDLLTIHRLLLAGDDDIALDFAGLVRAMASAINDSTGAYETIHASIDAIAGRNGVDLGEIAIPARVNAVPALAAGVLATGKDAARHIIDGDSAGVATIADAVRILHPMLPRGGDLDLVACGQEAERALGELPADGLLTFVAAGNGLGALDDGWGESEAWGTWSVAPRCVLRIPAPDRQSAACTIELACRVPLYGEHDHMAVACDAGGRRLGTWRFTGRLVQDVLAIDVPASAWGPDGTLSLELKVDRLRSPAQLGISADTRQLGLGVERLQLVRNAPPSMR